MTANQTVTSICNRALGAVGTRNTIQSISDGSNEAIQCTVYYDTTRQELLRSAYWNCALKTAILTLLKAQPGTPENDSAGTTVWDPATQPPPPWLYEYQYPSDCLRMRYITPQFNTSYTGTTPIFSVSTGASSIYPSAALNAVPFQIAMDTNSLGNNVQVILTNQSQAIAGYTVDLTTPPQFDSQFEAALVSALASYLVIPLTGELSKRQLLAADAKERVIQARVSDGNEGPQNQNVMAAWIVARGITSPWLGPGFVMNYSNPGFFAWA